MIGNACSRLRATGGFLFFNKNTGMMADVERQTTTTTTTGLERVRTASPVSRRSIGRS